MRQAPAPTARRTPTRRRRRRSSSSSLRRRRRHHHHRRRSTVVGWGARGHRRGGSSSRSKATRTGTGARSVARFCGPYPVLAPPVTSERVAAAPQLPGKPSVRHRHRSHHPTHALQLVRQRCPPLPSRAHELVAQAMTASLAAVVGRAAASVAGLVTRAGRSFWPSPTAGKTPCACFAGGGWWDPRLACGRTSSAAHNARAAPWSWQE